MTVKITTGRFTLTVVALAAFGPIGCGSGEREYGEVVGTVSLDGKPLPDVEVVFMPNPGQGTPAGAASCYTDESGRYRLRTGRANREGAVVGKHVVVINDVAAYPPPVLENGATLNAPAGTRHKQGKQRVTPKYSHPAETPFRDIEVHAGSQSIDLDLKSERTK